MLATSFPWIIYIAACVLEVFILLVRMPRAKRLWAGGALLLLLAFSQGALVLSEPLIFSIPFFVIGLYRLLNCMRYIYSRMHDEYLYRVVPRSSLIIGGVQTLVGLAALVASRHHPTAKMSLLIVSLIEVAAASLLFASFRVNLNRSHIELPEALPDKKLPSVSVLIPARNETDDLAACLKSLTASTYQKLEILVLDDCSQDKTSDIIKQFAHDGVRFIKGSEPGDVWLPKNAAYNKLAHEASGEYLLFCGVDVRFGPDDVKTLVTYTLQHKLSMVSVLPRRAKVASANSVAQQLRYLWEMALPRFVSHRPPVLSTLWLIQSTVLKKYGGMSAVRRNVVPEGFFARELDKPGLYRFLRAGQALELSSIKRPQEQRATALRVRYPQLHRKPEVAMAVTIFELLAIVSAYPIFVYGLVTTNWLLSGLSLLVLVLHSLIFIRLAKLMGTSASLRFYVGSFFAVAVDLWLMHRSMYLYEFDEVRWKERNVCLPVMHAIPSMPKLPTAKV